MHVQLKKVKVFMANSEETICFCGDIHIDGAKAGTARNSGNGEANSYYFDDPELRERFFKYCRSPPPVETEFGTFDSDEDLVIGDLMTLSVE